MSYYGQNSKETLRESLKYVLDTEYDNTNKSKLLFINDLLTVVKDFVENLTDDIETE